MHENHTRVLPIKINPIQPLSDDELRRTSRQDPISWCEAGMNPTDRDNIACELLPLCSGHPLSENGSRVVVG